MLTVEQKFDRKITTPFYGERIVIKDSSFAKLRSKIDACANRSDDSEKFRTAIFTRLFLILHYAEASSAITSIISTQKHIRDLASRSLDFLEYFYTLDCRRSITGMQSSRGMPSEQNIKDLRQWCTIDGKCDMELLRSITGMQHSRGMPSEQNIKDLRQWCTIDGKCDMELLRSITGMQNGRGELLRSITGMQNGRGMPSDEMVQMCIQNRTSSLSE
ncbi:hypothetical protein HYW84_02815 [Candidatus Peregrinibacteria bacterium]|nr:hypothetical protein [Candidatus Peregrinibacteria bacterium]